LPAEVRQQRTIVSHERLCGRGRDPIARFEIGDELPALPLRVIGAETRLLQGIPVGAEFASSRLRARLELPVDVMLPRRIRGQSQRAKGAPVVRDVAGEDLGAFVEIARADMVLIIPAVPEVARPELPGLEAQVLLLALADLVGAIALE